MAGVEVVISWHTHQPLIERREGVPASIRESAGPRRFTPARHARSPDPAPRWISRRRSSTSPPRSGGSPASRRPWPHRDQPRRLERRATRMVAVRGIAFPHGSISVAPAKSGLRLLDPPPPCLAQSRPVEQGDDDDHGEADNPRDDQRIRAGARGHPPGHSQASGNTLRGSAHRGAGRRESCAAGGSRSPRASARPASSAR